MRSKGSGSGAAVPLLRGRCDSASNCSSSEDGDDIALSGDLLFIWGGRDMGKYITSYLEVRGMGKFLGITSYFASLLSRLS